MSVRLLNLRTERETATKSVQELAIASVCSYWLIQMLEEGGTCTGDEAARIAAALGVSLETLGQAAL